MIVRIHQTRCRVFVKDISAHKKVGQQSLHMWCLQVPTKICIKKSSINWEKLPYLIFYISFLSLKVRALKLSIILLSCVKKKSISKNKFVTCLVSMVKKKIYFCDVQDFDEIINE